ncbi:MULTISPECIES: Gfo/Idh/MocA family protein [unclassified Microcella]|uniref:Gfo/Idh/MocA family protein n=1 Tax=unclassified Microcella TaxID=2630066 RepID=UPI0006FF04AC|nr:MULTISPECIES: Gfo/Idh/MocA family oxidoreductase [unclassified Microcella]KQV26860.1 dehydrogenase [Yonghaparkia sp. Root332]KRF33816.1 dehydrogenase [Yonghaparkia sp. Soil809]
MSSSTERPRAAIVGTGFIGAVHLDALRRLGVPVAGVLGSSHSRSVEFAQSWGLGRAYRDYDELLSDEAVDVVHITSPNDQHFPQARDALRAGKHVVCEKPLAMDSVETGQLAALAESTGLVAAVNFNIRFYPHVHEMRSRVATGSVGRPYLVTGSYLQDWLLLDTDWNWRLDSARGGDLRVVGDIGSHWFDLASFVTGQRIVEVMADLTTFIPVRRRPSGEVATFSAVSGPTTDAKIGSEDGGSILLRFDGGARGAVSVSQVSAGRKNAVSIEVSASTASLSWRGERPDELWIGHRESPNEVLLRDPALLSPSAASITRLPGGHAEGFENGFAALYAAVYGDVAAGGPAADPTYATFADGHYEALVIDAVAESARTSSWTAVADHGFGTTGSERT